MAPHPSHLSLPLMQAQDTATWSRCGSDSCCSRLEESTIRLNCIKVVFLYSAPRVPGCSFGADSQGIPYKSHWLSVHPVLIMYYKLDFSDLLVSLPTPTISKVGITPACVPMLTTTISCVCMLAIAQKERGNWGRVDLGSLCCSKRGKRAILAGRFSSVS